MVKKSSVISIISNNEDLADLLEEAFLLQGKFSLSIFNSDMFSDFISKTDIFDAFIISSDILAYCEKDQMNFFRKYEKKSIYLVDENTNQTIKENRINPGFFINIPLNFNNLTQAIETLIREEKRRMNNITMGQFTLDVIGKNISLEKNREKLTEKETEILWKLLSNIEKKTSQKDLLKEIWGYDEDIETRTLETHIYKIRKKLVSVGAVNFKINNVDNSYILTLDTIN